MTTRGDAWPAYGAAAWSFVFAVLHVVWAAGWYVGLDQELSRQAFAQSWFLIYDLVVAGMCLVAVWVALALAHAWRPRRLALVLALCGSTLLILRGGAGALQTAYVGARGGNVMVVYRLWEAWFCVGAFLFMLATWRFLRAPPRLAAPAATR